MTPKPIDRSGEVAISVVIPARNAAEHLVDQLQALAGQEWSGRWEVIVSDNGSRDRTVAIADDFKDRLPELRIVDSSRTRGETPARNAGAAAARGDALLFVDADDQVAPGYLAAMAEALDEHEFVAARLDAEHLNSGWILASREPPQQHGLEDFFGYMPVALSCSMGIRRSLFASLGGFTEGMPAGAEDVDLCWRAQRAGVPLVFVPEACVWYRYRGTLGDVYRQGRNYGRGHALLYRLYGGDGMPGSSVTEGLKKWISLVARLRKVRTKAKWARWIYRLGVYTGRLQGSLRYRVVYL